MSPSLGASGVAIVWLTVGLVTVVAITAMLIALVRHGILIGRTVSRFREEIAPITEEISALSAARAATRRRSSSTPGS